MRGTVDPVVTSSNCDDGYGERAEGLLARLGSDLTEHDFALLATACADQAGMRVRDQQVLASMLDGIGWSEEDRIALRYAARSVGRRP